MSDLFKAIAIILIAFFLLALSASCWIMSPWGAYNYTISERIGVAQWLVEAGGFTLTFAAGMLAAWQLYLAQRKPSLDIILYSYSPRAIQHGKTLDVELDANDRFPFKVLLHNSEPVPAEHVQFRMTVVRNVIAEPRGPARWKFKIELDQNSPFFAKWQMANVDSISEDELLTFSGGDDFISEGTDIIGSFILHALTRGDRVERFFASYTLKAKGMHLREGEVFFRLQPQER